MKENIQRIALLPAKMDWAERLLLLYIFFSPFTRLFYLPVFYAKIQPTELIFLALFPIFWRAYGWKWIPPRPWLLPLGGYVAINLLSGFWSGHLDAILEGMGRGYLAVLFGILLAYLNDRGTVGLERIAGAWLAGALLMAAVTLLGYGVANLGYINETVRFYDNYPYLGDTLRASGLTGGSGMLAIVLLFPLFYAWRQWRTGALPVLVPILLITVLFLTFAKEILLAGLGLLLVDPRIARLPSAWKAGAVAGTAIFFWVGAHFIFLPKGNNYLAGARYTSEVEIAQIGEIRVVESTYTALKKANIVLGLTHPWLGVGPGVSNDHLARLQSDGIYPVHLPHYDPHSTWTGAFSETGLLGLVALLWLTAAFIVCFYRSRSKLRHHPATHSALLFLLIMLIDSVSVDAMNMRQLWIALAIAGFGITSRHP